MSLLEFLERVRVEALALLGTLLTLLTLVALIGTDDKQEEESCPITLRAQENDPGVLPKSKGSR